MNYILGLFSLFLGYFYVMWNWLIIRPHSIGGGGNFTDLYGFVIVSVISILYLLIVLLSREISVYRVILLIVATVITMNFYLFVRYWDCFTDDGASIMLSNPEFADTGDFMPSFINYLLSLSFAVAITVAVIYRNKKLTRCSGC